jgi:2,5-furandicarboxylate decarboxylase 1
VTAPSDLKGIYTAAIARGERLPITFTLGTHPLDFFAATTRQGGDELSLVATFRGEPAPVVKSLTNDILVPADAEVTLEGYLDDRGYCEPEGPYGEYMGYYGAIHMDPVFHCTAITIAATRCIRRCCTAPLSLSTRPKAALSQRCAPKRRRCGYSRQRFASRSRSR